MAATDLGAGVAITFSSGFFAEILSVDGPTITRDAVETSHSTTTAKTFLPSKMFDSGELTVEMNFDADAEPPIDGDAAETCTLTLPTPTGGMTGATIVGSAFMTGYTPSIPIEDRMTATATLKYSGDLTWNDAT